jgi:hypothetical protein
MAGVGTFIITIIIIIIITIIIIIFIIIIIIITTIITTTTTTTTINTVLIFVVVVNLDTCASLCPRSAICTIEGLVRPISGEAASAVGRLREWVHQPIDDVRPQVGSWRIPFCNLTIPQDYQIVECPCLHLVNIRG